MSDCLIGGERASLRLLDLYLRPEVENFLSCIENSGYWRITHESSVDEITGKLDQMIENVKLSAFGPDIMAIRKELGEIRGLLNDGADPESSLSDETRSAAKQRMLYFYCELLPKFASAD